MNKEELFEEVKEKEEELKEAIENAKNKAGKTLSDSLDDFWNASKLVYEDAKKHITDLYNNVKDSQKVQEAASEVRSKLTEYTKTGVAFVKESLKDPKLKEGLATVGKSVNDAAYSLKQQIAKNENLYNAFQKVADVTNQTVDSISKSVKDLIDNPKVKEGVQQAVSAVSETAEKAVESVKNLFEKKE
ncbi:MAG: hypothetical protein LBR25_02775 [Erysipelotrichaceae bacterium]|jgi:vacuolar-type H+-ATPase subunit H|nr:hypothetical protein [Erysipelotrichaceae bacterium]